MNFEIKAKPMKIKRSLDDTYMEYKDNKSDGSFSRNKSAQKFYSREDKVK